MDSATVKEKIKGRERNVYAVSAGIASIKSVVGKQIKRITRNNKMITKSKNQSLAIQSVLRPTRSIE